MELVRQTGWKVLAAMSSIILAVGGVAIAGGFDRQVVERRVAVAPVTTARQQPGVGGVVDAARPSVLAVRTDGEEAAGGTRS